MSTRSSEVERIIATAEVDTTFAGKKARYRGRRSTWPGALGLFLLAVGSIVGLTLYGIKVNADVEDTIASDSAVRNQYTSGTEIEDGKTSDNTTDLSVTNPASYTDKKCEQPDYQSKDGRIVAVFSDGTETTLDIKGVNWKGMEDSKGVPKGLWDNTRDGSTLYRVGQYLHRNNFNVVRLPLSIDAALRNTDVDSNLINTNSNRALASASRYLELLGLVVQGLGQFNIGIVLDFHVLSAVDDEADDGLWYGSSIQIDDIKTAISNLAEELCNSKHFNVIGIDLKDGVGQTATWGDGSDTDWYAAATTLGNHLVTKCPQWLAFVQGVQGSSHKDTYEGDRSIKNKFPAGSDLTGVADYPITLSTSNKVVYSPKYFTSSYLPYAYFFDSGTSNGDMLDDYVESSDDTLRANVKLNMDYMWNSTYGTGAAVVLSSFGGLVGDSDATEKQTSTRIVKILVEHMQQSSEFLAGGFWWTLNPDTYWPYPAPDSSNSTASGLVDDTWRAANMDVQDILETMDAMTNVNTIPCVTA